MSRLTDAPDARAGISSFDAADRGTLANFAVIDHDIMRMPPKAIRYARATMTVVGGRVVYESGGQSPAPDPPIF